LVALFYRESNAVIACLSRKSDKLGIEPGHDYRLEEAEQGPEAKQGAIERSGVAGAAPHQEQARRTGGKEAQSGDRLNYDRRPIEMHPVSEGPGGGRKSKRDIAQLVNDHQEADDLGEGEEQEPTADTR
jgi:hypothetical protein